MAGTLALALLNHLTKTEIVVLCVLMWLLLNYGCSGWVFKSRLSVAERMGHAGLVMLITTCAVGLYGWHFWPDWHLTQDQENGLATLAREIPQGVGVLVELPVISEMGQEYGKDIMRVLHDNGTKVNQIVVYRGTGETPVGVLVSVRNINDPAYQPAILLSGGMFQLKMPAKFQYGDPLADATTMIIYVGTKPRDD